MIALLSRMAARAAMEGSKSMARRKRWNHSLTFKAQVALVAMKGDRTLAELAQQYDIHPNLPPAQSDHRPAEPGLGCRHYLHPDAPGICLSGRRGGLVRWIVMFDP